MDIVENLNQWANDYEQGWLAHFKATGNFDWKIYPKIKNQSTPTGPAIKLSQSRLGLISTAGGYLSDTQKAFDAAHPLGDYTIRCFPISTPLHAISYAHDHYDHTAVKKDPQVLLPLRHLEDMMTARTIGELGPNVINFMGYQPDIRQVINETIVAIVAEAKAQALDAALLVPS